MAQASRDQNFVPTLLAVSNTDGVTPVKVYADPTTHRLLTDSAGGGIGTVTEIDSGTGIKLTPDPITTTGTVSLTDVIAPIATLGSALQLIRVNAGATALEYFTAGAGTGTVTTVSVVSANGFAGTVANATTTPAITISTSINAPVLAGNGTALTAATTTGSGSTVVLATSPTLVTPVLGAATATTINKVTITAPASSAVLTIADGKTATHNATTTFAGTDGKTLTISNSGTLSGGDAFVLSIAAAKTLTVSNTLTFTGTDSSSVAFGTGGTVLYTSSTVPLTVGTTTIASGTNTRILYDNSGVLGEYTLTGSGTVVAMQTAPTFITSATVPLIIGGSGTTGTQLTLQTTTGNGTTDALVIKGGNNGASTFATFTTGGALTLSTSGTLTTGTIELGAASDTTLARVSAGVISVEGVTVATASNSLTLTSKTITDGVNTVATPTTTSIGYLGIPQNSQTAAYTTVLTDAGKMIFHPSSDTNVRTYTIDSNANVAYPIGTTLTFINQTANVVTIAITTDTMTLANSTTTGNRSLAQNGVATAIKVASTSWIISGVGLT